MDREEAARTLGCQPNSTPEEITRTFRKLAMKSHPDRPGGSEEAFLRISAAYEALLSVEERDRITKSRFDRFRMMYEGSPEEEEEVCALYKKHKGSLQKIVDGMLLGQDEQENRYKEIITRLIKARNLPEYPRYKTVSLLANARRQKRRQREALRAEELAKQLEKSAQGREARWTAMMARLEEQAHSRK